MKDESFYSALLDFIEKKLKELKEWLRPDQEDPFLLKSIKFVGKAIVLVILTVFSPVVLLILIISFFAAF